MLLVFREVTNGFVSKIRRTIKIRTRSPRKARAEVRRIRMAKIASTNQRNGGLCRRKSVIALLRYVRNATPRLPQLLAIPRQNIIPFPVFKPHSATDHMKKWRKGKSTRSSAMTLTTNHFELYWIAMLTRVVLVVSHRFF
jgi:hypothetical protein